jgi:murein L,D-transpeptidase YcbB/YkuD
VESIETLCGRWWLHHIGDRPGACDELEHDRQSVAKWTEAYRAAVRDTGLTEGELAELAAHLRSLPPSELTSPDGSVSDGTLVAAMFGVSGRPGALAPDRAEFAGLEERADKVATALATFEATARSILFEFAWRLRGRHVGKQWEATKVWMDWLDALAAREERRADGDHSALRYTPAEGWPESSEAAAAAFVRQVVESVETKPGSDILAWLNPSPQQYDRLLDAHERYQGTLKAGGFVTLPSPKGDLKRNARSPAAQVLRRRLAQEGYLPAGDETSDVFDDAVIGALASFQRAHQLDDGGKLDKATRSALNVSAGERVRQLQAALSAWQATEIRPDYFVFVNIPDFHGEVWRAGKQQRRFRVVVGNRTQKRVEGKRTFVNATPVIGAAIDRVVYNPYWNIPKRILAGEVLPQEILEGDPEVRQGWLEGKGYELMAGGTEWEWVRQPPGPGNALGQVKIIFPNPHETYLHDTPSKKLFDRPWRAFSHGCVRVHDPLELAKLLLQNDGQYDPKEVDSLLRRRENKEIFLNQKVRIFIEYILVRVGDDGVVNFLDDIYDRLQP